MLNLLQNKKLFTLLQFNLFCEIQTTFSFCFSSYLRKPEWDLKSYSTKKDFKKPLTSYKLIFFSFKAFALEL